MTDIADTLQKIDTIASQRGQQDELTSLVIHACRAASLRSLPSPFHRNTTAA